MTFSVFSWNTRHKHILYWLVNTFHIFWSQFGTFLIFVQSELIGFKISVKSQDNVFGWLTHFLRETISGPITKMPFVLPKKISLLQDVNTTFHYNPGDFVTNATQINSQSDLISMSSSAGLSYLAVRSSVYMILIWDPCVINLYNLCQTGSSYIRRKPHQCVHFISMNE